MKTTFQLILIFAILTIIGCNKSDDIYIDNNDILVGNWIDPEYEDSKTIFKRANELKKDGYGISFLKNNIFIERHSGWCGTPPLTFANYEGEWERKDSIIYITINNGMAGNTSYYYKIISLNETTLIIEKEN
jgi:hypothetical protein